MEMAEMAEEVASGVDSRSRPGPTRIIPQHFQSDADEVARVG